MQPPLLLQSSPQETKHLAASSARIGPCRYLLFAFPHNRNMETYSWFTAALYFIGVPADARYLLDMS